MKAFPENREDWLRFGAVMLILGLLSTLLGAPVWLVPGILAWSVPWILLGRHLDRRTQPGVLRWLTGLIFWTVGVTGIHVIVGLLTGGLTIMVILLPAAFLLFWLFPPMFGLDLDPINLQAIKHDKDPGQTKPQSDGRTSPHEES